MSSNRVALVTGGAAGIGRAIALALAEAGTSVAIVDRCTLEKAQPTVTAIEATGVNAMVLEASVDAFDEAQRCVDAVRAAWGRLDILICNAGTNRDGVVWKMDEADWDTVLAVNLKGCFNYIRAASAGFREQKSGKIVAVTSINGLRGKFGQANYAASKAGLVGLIKTVARELGCSGVNVNAVAPGLIETTMTQDLPAAIRQKAIDESALGRVGQPEDVAAVVRFLCSEGARQITGEVIKVDGGQYI